MPCEVCKRKDVLIACASLDEAMLWFCPWHYIYHVYSAHNGRVLPGCTDLIEARRLTRGTRRLPGNDVLRDAIDAAMREAEGKGEERDGS